MKNLWSEKTASGLSALDQLVYQSRLIGADPSLVLWGGGNTSLKTTERDFRGLECSVLRVKGSGTDMKSIQRQGFPGVLMEHVLALFEREDMSDEDMVDYLSHCLVEPDAPRPSIETLLHAFIPQTSIVHSHADAILSMTNTTRPEAILTDVFGSSVVAVSYRRPGFLLSKEVALNAMNSPQARGVVLLNHGLVTWGDTLKAAYDSHVALVSQAEEFIEQAGNGKRVFAQIKGTELSAPQRLVVAASITPTIRGLVGREQRAILRFEDGDEVMEFVNSSQASDLISLGAATPDHLLNTKRVPLLIDVSDPNDLDVVKAKLQEGIAEYADSYGKWFALHSDGQHHMLDPFPRVILLRGVGMWTTGKDARATRITADIYRHTIGILAGSQALDKYSSLSLQEAYDSEYWPLELYKQSLAPPEKELSRRIALVTGAASGIGRAIAIRFAQEGAHVMVTDIQLSGAKRVAEEIAAQYGEDRVRYCKLDVSNEKAVKVAFEATRLAFGGLDILVSNAGIAITSPIDKLSLSDWQASLAVNSTGHFLAAKEAVGILREQNLGGSLIFIATKNVPAPGQNIGAYSASKAAEAQLARVLAIENGSHGIRSNMINPDAIFRNSNLWSPHIREERAQAHGISVDQVEDFYRQRTLLKVSVTAEDVAEAALYLAGNRALKTTGAMLPVDGGVREAFPR
jgi:rhamnulose-1-phosphate aldolase/alcohol dehydrogenase